MKHLFNFDDWDHIIYGTQSILRPDNEKEKAHQPHMDLDRTNINTDHEIDEHESRNEEQVLKFNGNEKKKRGKKKLKKKKKLKMPNKYASPYSYIDKIAHLGKPIGY